VHPRAIAADLGGRLGLSKMLLGASGTRSLTKKDMLRNDYLPEMRVDPETFDVYVDGEIATCEPARELPLTQRYMLR
jgi:urease subunit alpha